jgi:hypothetical protein
MRAYTPHILSLSLYSIAHIRGRDWPAQIDAVYLIFIHVVCGFILHLSVSVGNVTNFSLIYSVLKTGTPMLPKVQGAGDFSTFCIMNSFGETFV